MSDSSVVQDYQRIVAAALDRLGPHAEVLLRGSPAHFFAERLAVILPKLVEFYLERIDQSALDPATVRMAKLAEELCALGCWVSLDFRQRQSAGLDNGESLSECSRGAPSRSRGSGSGRQAGRRRTGRKS
jgi:hypothetical protein